MIGVLQSQKTDLSPNEPRASTATGRTDTTADTNGTTLTEQSSTSNKDSNRQNKRTEERKQRGLMQWKPARNLKFAKDEGKIGLRKLKKKLTGGMEGRQPGVETGECIAAYLVCGSNLLTKF